MLFEFLKREVKSKYSLVLILIFIFSSAYILSFPYPWGGGAPNPNLPGGHHQPPPKQPWQVSMWSGGTIPDENAYFQWAWIYYITGKTYVPLEDIGPDKIQHFNIIIGSSPQNSYFIRVTISHLEQIWESKFRNVTVEVYNGLNHGTSGIPVDVINKKTGDVIHGITNNSGEISFGLQPGFYRAVAHINSKILNFDFSTNFQNLDYPIISYAVLENFSETVSVKIHVDHYINGNLSGVEIHMGKNSTPVGYTDKNGNFYLHVQPNGVYDIATIKRTYHISPPVGSVVVYVNGEYALANRWAPGYSYLIIPFWLSGLINYITIFTFFIGSISTYILSRRLYGRMVAFYSTVLFMLSALSLMMLFSRGMADYATMAFSTMGIMLLVESLQKRKYDIFINPLLAFSGGLSLGFAVLIRYSTVTVVLAPLIYLAVRLVKIRKERRFKKELLSFFIFLIALVLMGSVIASYNTSMFGGPLNSGYQMSHTIEFNNGNATVEAPSTNMFEKYFHPSMESLSNVFNRILPQLFILLPTLFIAPLGFFLDYKRNRTWLMFFWGIPTLFIYMQLQWVGHVPYEDMRYFLPLLPPTAILSGFAIDYIRNRNYEKFFFYTLFMILGFIASFFAINWQLHRRGPTGMFWSHYPLYLFIIAVISYICIYLLVIWAWIEKRDENNELSKSRHIN